MIDVIKRIFRLAPVLLPVLLLTTACTSGSYTTIGSIENNTSTGMSMSYQYFNGYKANTFHLDSGETAEADVDIKTEEGKLSLSITDQDGGSCYQGTDLPTSSFSVKLEKSGDYTVRFDAVKHMGSYKLEWKIGKE